MALVSGEATLTRLVRRLLQLLKAQVLANTSLSVSIDYDDQPNNELRAVVMAELPALVISGPTLRSSRFYSTNVPVEVNSDKGFTQIRPARTFDLSFSMTGASERTLELLQLMAAVAMFFNRNPWIELERDPQNPALGRVRWEMDSEGDVRTSLRDPRGVRAFSCSLVIRGVDVDEGLPFSSGQALDEVGVEVGAIVRDSEG